MIFLASFPDYFPSFLCSFCFFHCLSISLHIGFQVHVVDGSSLQPDLEFDAVRLELELFSPEIAEKPYIVAYNKMDLPEANEKWPSFKEGLQSRGITPYCMSAVKREGTHEVICAAYELLHRSKEAKEEYQGLNFIKSYSEHSCLILSYFWSGYVNLLYVFLHVN